MVRSLCKVVICFSSMYGGGLFAKSPSSKGAKAGFLKAYNFDQYVLKKTTDNKGITRVRYDLNRDSKVDQIDSYRGKFRFQRELDLNFDGRFDKVIHYYSDIKNDIFKEVQSDKNFDGKFDRKETFKQVKALNKIVIQTKLDRDFNGTMESSFSNVLTLVQNSNAYCREQLSLLGGRLEKIPKSVISNLSREGDFYVTGFGFKIHRDCFDKLGKRKALNIVKNSVFTGLQCLMDLQEKYQRKNGKGAVSGALRNAVDLEELLEEGDVKLVCGEKDFNWSGGVRGHASAEAGTKIRNYNGLGYDVGHPFISISPEAKERSEESVTRTLFHEFLHNAGWLHGEGVEYPYTCGSCCFPSSKKSKRAIELSCKICANESNTFGTREYTLDLIDWTRAHKVSRATATKTLTMYIKEHPNDKRWGIIQLAKAQSGPSNPVAIELAELLKRDLSNPTSGELKELDHLIEKHKNSEGTQQRKEQARPIAQVLHALYFKEDREEALNIIERNIKPLKEGHPLVTPYIENRQILHIALDDIWSSEESSSQQQRRVSSIRKQLK